MCRLEVCGRNRPSRASEVPACPHHQLQWSLISGVPVLLYPQPPHHISVAINYSINSSVATGMPGNLAGWWPGCWGPHGTSNPSHEQCGQGTVGTARGTENQGHRQPGGQRARGTDSQGDGHRSWMMAGWGCSQGTGQGQGCLWCAQPWHSAAKLCYHTWQPSATCWFSFSFSLSTSGQIFPVMGMIRFLHENQFSHQVQTLFRLSGEADLLKEKITVNFCLSAIYYRSSSSWTKKDKVKPKSILKS